MSYEHLRGLMGGTPPHTTPGLPITGVSPRPHLSLVPETVEDEFESAEVETDQWQDRALCAQTDPEAFFPEKGGSTREAKKVCLGCEVRHACLDYALAHDERFGIWGGVSERERRRLKRGVILSAKPAWVIRRRSSGRWRKVHRPDRPRLGPPE